MYYTDFRGLNNIRHVTIKDMYHYAIPLLEKKPENIILHLGTNDAP